MIAVGERTTLTKATSKSNSLRTTVPIFIVKQFGLNEGDMLDWELGVFDGKLSIIVKPVKREGVE